MNGDLVFDMVADMVADLVPSGGGGSNWILSGGIWNDSGVWDDSASWED